MATLENSLQSLKQIKEEIKSLNQQMSEAAIAGDEKRFSELKKNIGELKNDYRDLQQEMQYADPGEMLAGMTKVAQGAVGAFGAVTGTLDLIGVKNENIQVIQQKSMAIIQVLTSLESARQLLEGKGLIAGLAGQIKKSLGLTTQTVLTKELMATEVAEGVTKTAIDGKEIAMIGAKNAATTQGITLTTIWNGILKAMSGPIGWIVAGIASLTAGLLVMNNYIMKGNEATAEMIAKGKVLKKTHDDVQKSTGEVSSKIEFYRKIVNDTTKTENERKNAMIQVSNETNGQIEATDLSKEALKKWNSEADLYIQKQIAIATTTSLVNQIAEESINVINTQRTIDSLDKLIQAYKDKAAAEKITIKENDIWLTSMNKSKKEAEKSLETSKAQIEFLKTEANKAFAESSKYVTDNTKAVTDNTKAVKGNTKAKEDALEFSNKYAEAVMSEYDLLKKNFEDALKENDEYLKKKEITTEQHQINIANINKLFTDKAKKLDAKDNDIEIVNAIDFLGKKGKATIDTKLRTGAESKIVTKKLSDEELKDLEEAEANKIKAKEDMYALAQETSFQLANELFTGYMDRKQAEEEAILAREQDIINQQSEMKMKALDQDREALQKNLELGLISQQQFADEKAKLDAREDAIEANKRKRELDLERKKFELQQKAAKSDVMIKVANEIAKALIAAAVHAAGVATLPLVPFDIAMAGAAGAVGAAQIANINKQKPGFKLGGIVGGEFGTDNNMIMASRGEFIINPSSTANNIDLLKAINSNNNTDVMQQILQAINNQKVTVSDRDIKTVGKKVSTIEARSSF